MTVVTLAEIADQIRGVSYGKTDVVDRPAEGFLPVLRANNITDDGLSFDDLVYVRAAKVSAKQQVLSGDIVIAASSGSISVVGKAAQAEHDLGMGFGAFCKVVRPSSKVHARYIGHFFKTQDYRRRMSALAAGANINNLKNEHIDEIEIPLPPLDDQKRIAAILDQADELRRKRQRAIDRLNQLGQAIFHEMFGGPANYPTASLKSLGKVSTGSTPPTSDASSFGGTVPFITPGDLGSDQDVKRTLTESGAAKSRLVAAGATFVCCIGATIGKMDQATARSAFNQQINAVEWSDQIDPTFGFFAIQQIRDVIIHKGKGASTTLPILKKSEFEKLQVIAPPLNEQRQFAGRIHRIRDCETSLSAHRDRLEVLFSSLQHRAFRGEL